MTKEEKKQRISEMMKELLDLDIFSDKELDQYFIALSFVLQARKELNGEKDVNQDNE